MAGNPNLELTKKNRTVKTARLNSLIREASRLKDAGFSPSPEGGEEISGGNRLPLRLSSLCEINGTSLTHQQFEFSQYGHAINAYLLIFACNN